MAGWKDGGASAATRHRARRSHFKFRTPHSALRTVVTLPTFLIIGAAKSGTTSLYHYLRQHPEVFMPAVKEPRYFAYADDPPAMEGPGDRASNEAAGAVYTWDAYRALFEDTDDAQVAGEASVNYLYSPSAPRRIAERLPDATLVAVLRNPVERAYSHFLHLVRSGREPLRDFTAALDAEDERRETGWEWSWHYAAMGHYAEQLERYLDRFDRDQLVLYRFEAFKDDPAGVTQDLYRRLGVDPSFEPDTSLAHAKTGVPKSSRFQQFLHNPDHPLRRWSRSILSEEVRFRILTMLKNLNLAKPPMPPAARRRLATRYRDDVRRLEEIMNEDLSDWLSTEG
jgi:hypothetical protein